MKNSIICFLSALFFSSAFAQPAMQSYQLKLNTGWQMQSAVTDNSSAQSISVNQFNPSNWYKVSVPTTIIGGLLANKVYKFDPFYAQNFEKLKDSKLDQPWWFRRQFSLPSSESGKNVILFLHGINYKANIWFNGVKIADSTQTKGPFRMIKLDVTKYISYTSENVLALEIKRPFNPNKSDGDLAIDYADWIHYPPDYNGGIVNDITVNTFNKVGVEYPLVTTNFDLPDLKVAHLTVDAQVVNYTDKPQDALIKGRINDSITFEHTIHLVAFEAKDISFSPDEFKQLNIQNPRIWWPWQYGKPELNRVEMLAEVDKKVSNRVSENFGIRQISSKFLNNKAREFLVNGKPIMLRGAAWSPDIFQRRSEERQEQEVKLARDMNLNIIRSEGKFEDDHFYDLCDKYGMLVMTGWMCCGTWQHPEHWDPTERKVAMASDSSMMYWLRNKASLLAWLNGSDMPPTDTTVERSFLNIEKALKFPNPILATANSSKSKVSGYSGVKMLGPYEWVPPIYWETDATKNYGGAWSFSTEISPGPSIPPYESLIKFLPMDSLTTTSADWLYHCGTMSFGNTKIFNAALDGRYGRTTSIKNYVAKAQAQNYEAHRAMMEAYGLYKYNTATGVVQWMMSNPWPSLIWHTYDYYLYPAGTYFGIKKGLETLHVQYSYKSHEVSVINSLLSSFDGLRVTATLYNLNGTVKHKQGVTTTVGPDAAKVCFTIPPVDGLSNTYFLRLEVADAAGKSLSINWYWLSNQQDELNWKKSNWFTTPQSTYADYSALQIMPKVLLKQNHKMLLRKDSVTYAITVTNKGSAVAFFVHLRALKSKGADDILPVIFSDNYFSLAPGETRVIKCKYHAKDSDQKEPYFLTSAWNIDTAKSESTLVDAFETGLPEH